MKETVETVFEELVNIYQTNLGDFFFTEKELHSYFLNLCLKRKDFVSNGYLLIHAEYPTPFKCSYNKSDVVVLEEDNSTKIRAHIDMVSINPNYVQGK